MKTVPFFLISAMMYIVFASNAVYAQSTEFTYQGTLSDNAVPANGNYDFEFGLFDMLSGGSQFGTTAARNNVPVTNGIFTVTLDFGSVFPGTPRYLEIRVRLAGQPGITILGPRQLLTSAPHAVKSIDATNAETATNSTQLGGIAANQYVVTTDPRLSDERAPTAGSSNYIQNQNAGPQASSNFNISGNGTLGGDLAVGGQLTLNIVNAQTQYNIGGLRIFGTPGVENTFAGKFAGNTNTTGTGNSFFGYQAGQANTTAAANSYFGAFAGALSTGNNNAFFGNQAGSGSTTGSSNSFFGSGAGIVNAGGTSNSFFGRNAGLANTGSNNSFFGAFAGDANVTGVNNSFFGINAGGANTTGSTNSFFGAGAGLSNTTASTNSFFGYNAGSANITGIQNSFFGATAGQSNTTASSNSFFGAGAGFMNTGGTNNSFFGQGAGFSNTASGNSFFGADAGTSNTTGANNAFFGAGAGINNVTGSNNAFFGANAGDVTTAANNAFFGSSAGGANTSGGNNAFVGTQAGIFNTIGFSNSALGSGAGPGLGFSNLSFATAIGAGSIVSTNNTIVLGRPAGEDVVSIPGTAVAAGDLRADGRVRVGTLGSAGLSTHLCLNGVNDIAACSSSLRYKTNIHSFTDGLSFINQLRPIAYNWKDGGVKDIGFGAEDVAEIDQRFVVYNSLGQVEGIKYDRLTTVLVNALKEQQAQIETQKTQYQLLLDRLEKQDREMAELRKLVRANKTTAPCGHASQEYGPK